MIEMNVYKNAPKVYKLYLKSMCQARNPTS